MGWMGIVVGGGLALAEPVALAVVDRSVALRCGAFASGGGLGDIAGESFG